MACLTHVRLHAGTWDPKLLPESFRHHPSSGNTGTSAAACPGSPEIASLHGGDRPAALSSSTWLRCPRALSSMEEAVNYKFRRGSYTREVLEQGLWFCKDIKRSRQLIPSSLCLLMPLSNMRSHTAFPTAPVGQKPGAHREAGVTAAAAARPFGCISPSRSPTTGAATRDEPGLRRTEPLETGAQTNSKETGPCPTRRDYSHGHVARDPGTGCLGAGRSPAGSPKMARAFLGSRPRTRSFVWGRSPAAPAAGERVVDATGKGKGEGGPLAAARFQESRRAVKQVKVLCTGTW